jgi:hypothetical protein
VFRAYHQLWQIEKSFQTSKTDLRFRDLLVDAFERAAGPVGSGTGSSPRPEPHGQA